MNDSSDITLLAKNFVIEKYKNKKQINDIKLVLEHLEGIINRLKYLGITDVRILSAAWLHNIANDTEVNYDQINQRFGKETALLILPLIKDRTLLKNKRERQFINQLKFAPLESKLIKLCEISSNLKRLSSSSISNTQKKKEIKSMQNYLRVIIKEILENRASYPKIQEIIDGINIAWIKLKQKPIQY
jgi:(p)ppGpp synthase/HD superfamily hydrolase